MRTKKTYYTSMSLIVGIIFILNIVSNDFFARLDLTDNGRYTLSKATKDILDDIVEPVTIKAYFSTNLPPNIQQTRSDLREMLVEYSSLSDGNLIYEFIDPLASPVTEQEANQVGIGPIMINVREKDQMKQQKAYLGVIVQMREDQEVIPFIRPGEAMEYALTSSIKKLSVIDKPSIALIQGHGEPSTFAMQQAGEVLNVLYNFENFSMTDTTEIPERFKTVAIVAPKDTIPENHLNQLDKFLSKGGNLLIAMDRVQGDLRNGYGTTLSTGLESWLNNKGINVENSFLVDASAASVRVQQQRGFFNMSSNVLFPYFPVLSNFRDHPVSGGLEGVTLQFASPINYSGDSTVRFTPLAMSSELSGTAAVPVVFSIEKQWSESDFPLSNQVVAGAFEGQLSGDTESKMILIGDGDFAINMKEGATQPQPLSQDNVSLFVNSIDWLSDDTGLIELRTKGVTSRPLAQLTDGRKRFLKYLNFLLPIVLIIIYGVVRMQMKRKLRLKRMEESYV